MSNINDILGYGFPGLIKTAPGKGVNTANPFAAVNPHAGIDNRVQGGQQMDPAMLMQVIGQLGQQRLESLDDVGVFGGIRNSPANRGGRLNNPFGDAQGNGSYFRTREERDAEIARRQGNFADPVVLQQNAQAAVAARRQEQQDARDALAQDVLSGGAATTPDGVTYHFGDRQSGARQMQSGNLQGNADMVTMQIPEEYGGGVASGGRVLGNSQDPFSGAYDPRGQQAIVGAMQEIASTPQQIETGVTPVTPATPPYEHTMINSSPKWNAMVQEGMKQNAEAEAKENSVWNQMVQEGTENTVNAPIPNPFWDPPGGEEMGTRGLVPTVRHKADIGLSMLLDWLDKVMMGDQSNQRTRDAEQRLRNTRAQQFQF